MKHPFKILPLPVALLCVAAACSNSECYDNKNSLPLAGFYSSDSVPQQLTLQKISIFGIGAPGDSILHSEVSGLKETYLPFRIDQPSSTYVIQYLSGLLGEFGIADTITFNYEIIPWFVSSACGVVYDYKMLDIVTTHNIIDSVTCPVGTITNADIENIRIYFRVNEPDEDENPDDQNPDDQNPDDQNPDDENPGNQTEEEETYG